MTFEITHSNGNVRIYEASEIKSVEITELRGYIEIETSDGVWLAKKIEIAGD